jgi:hypothetical protein
MLANESHGLWGHNLWEQMMITGQKPIRKSKQGSFQIVEIVEFMRPLTKVLLISITHSSILCVPLFCKPGVYIHRTEMK